MAAQAGCIAMAMQLTTSAANTRPVLFIGDSFYRSRCYTPRIRQAIGLPTRKQKCSDPDTSLVGAIGTWQPTRSKSVCIKIDRANRSPPLHPDEARAGVVVASSRHPVSKPQMARLHHSYSDPYLTFKERYIVSDMYIHHKTSSYTMTI